MIAKKKKGRPMRSRDVKVTPEFRDTPDIEKLGRALIAVAVRIAEQRRSDKNAGNMQEPHRNDDITR